MRTTKPPAAPPAMGTMFEEDFDVEVAGESVITVDTYTTVAGGVEVDVTVTTSISPSTSVVVRGTYTTTGEGVDVTT